MVKTLLHLSDLHLGKDPRNDAEVRRLAARLAASPGGPVVVSGDLTQRGRRAELRAFEDAFAPLLAAGRVALVPGNHDRMTEDAGAGLMGGARVAVTRLPGLHLVRVDSTAPHNRRLLLSHGRLSPGDLAEVDLALADAPRGALVALALHHHVLPLPGDHLGEALADWLGWPHAAEVAEGGALLALARGRCDLVLHGHRHTPSVLRPFPADPRPLAVVNAGCTPELGRVRRYHHAGGALLGIDWLDLRLPAAAPLRPAPAPAPLRPVPTGPLAAA